MKAILSPSGQISSGSMGTASRPTRLRPVPPYTAEFFRQHQGGAKRSAQAIVPLVVDLFNPRSVVDIGCGLGTWLAVFRDHGVTDVLGIDGDHIDREMLEIEGREFLAFDLRSPLYLDRGFDLATCLEVAEHLPESSARFLVGSLVRLAPVVVFSAAIPFQGGTSHLNEQWPDYWVKQFDTEGYVAIDCIRRRIWSNGAIEWWYAQNLLVFIKREKLGAYQRLVGELADGVLPLVHPNNYENTIALLSHAIAAADPRNMSVRQVLSYLSITVAGALRRRASGSRQKKQGSLRLGGTN